jgi:hypothetical protein
VPGRAPLVRARDGGRFYEFAWQRLLVQDPATRPWLVHVETWNEFHEGTEICQTKEYGRQYIELTRKFADLFHARQRLDASQIAPSRPQLSATPEKSEGLTLSPKPEGDGPVDERTVGGRRAWSTRQNRHSPLARYLYFEAEEYFLYDGDQTLEVTVTYWDAGPREFVIEYDSSDPQREGLGQQFRDGPRQPVTGSGQWKQAAFTLPHARFAGRANGADFRLACQGADLVVAEVTVRRRPEH